MRKMIFRVTATLLLVCAAAVTACQTDPDISSGDNLTVYVEALEAKPEGETLRFPYEINNSKSDFNLVVTCDDEWVTAIEIYPSLVDVTVACNRSGAERSTTLKLSYGNATKSVAITQKPWFEPLSLTIDKIEATAITISVVALNEDTTWIGQIVGKEWFDSYTEEEIFEEDLTYYHLMASDAEQSIEEYLASILSRGSHSGIRMKGLDVDSEYVVYVYGLNSSGEKTSALYYEAFRTTPPYEGDDVTYTFDVECSRSTAFISVQPSHEGVAYYHNVTTREHYDRCGGTLEAMVESVVATALENYLYWEYTEEEFYSYNTEYLATTYDMEVTANTEYILFAFKWDENLKPLSEVSYKWFTSPDIPPSDNQLSMTVSDVTQTTFYIDVKTTNNDPYTIFAVPEKEIKKFITDDQIFGYLIDEYGAPSLDYNQCEGDISGMFSGLESDTDYAVLLFGYEAGIRTTAMLRENIKTTKAGDIEACLYDVEITDIDDRTAHVTITPSDYSVWYYWNVFEKSMTEEQIKEYIDQLYKSYYYADYSEFSWSEITQGKVDSNLSQLRTETEYNVVVIPMNPNKYEYTGAMRVVGEFTTKEAVIADINITAGFDAYYDGDELNAIAGDDWDFSHYAGYVVLPMSVRIDKSYSGFLYTIFDYVDGLEDPEKYHDDILLNTLYEVGAYWTPATFRAAWDKPLMIAAVAFDEAGNPSRVYREVFSCSRDKAGDAQEFIDVYMGGSSTFAATPKPTHSFEARAVEAYDPIATKTKHTRGLRLNRR